MYPRILSPIPTDQRVLFLWMPKCAGVTIHYALQVAYRDGYVALNNQQSKPLLSPLDQQCVTFYHSHIPALVEASVISQQWVDSAFRFAFVRNPWDRLVSLYHYLVDMRYRALPSSFEDFVVRVCAREQSLHSLGPYNLLGFYQANSLLDWLRPRGTWLPHFIGRFENLQEDWKIVCRILGVPHRVLGINNPSKHDPYPQYYNVHTRNLVALRFCQEIEIFDYHFGENQ